MWNLKIQNKNLSKRVGSAWNNIIGKNGNENN